MIIENKIVINKMKYKFNNFIKYSSSVFEVIQINSKIQNVCNKLKKLSANHDHFNEVLNKIEMIIDG